MIGRYFIILFALWYPASAWAESLANPRQTVGVLLQLRLRWSDIVRRNFPRNQHDDGRVLDG